MVETCLSANGREPAKEERWKATEGIIYSLGPQGERGKDPEYVERLSFNSEGPHFPI